MTKCPSSTSEKNPSLAHFGTGTNQTTPREVRLGWTAKAIVFTAAVVFIPDLENRLILTVFLACTVPLQFFWHRVLPHARLSSSRPLHDCTLCLTAAALAPSLWVPALLIFVLSLCDPAYRRRSQGINAMLGVIGIALVFVGAASESETWLAGSIAGGALILLRSSTGDKIWAELEANELHRSELLDAVSAVVWTADPELGKATWVSPNIERVMGWTAREWVERDHRELIHPDDLADFWIDATHLQDGAEFERSARYRHKDGRWVWLSIVNRALEDVDGRLKLYGYFTDATDLIERHAKMRRQASVDALTGLSNRHVLIEELTKRLAAPASRFALLMIDLDRFKEINDTLGHSIGDDVLRTIAKRLSEAAPDDLVCRLGGDEFAVLIEDPSSLHHIVSGIGDRSSQPITVGDVTVSSAVSVGSVMAPTDATTVGDVLRRGDAAMYQAKRRGLLHLPFSDDMERRNDLELELSANLVTALESGQFELHFQPQIDLVSGNVVGAEGLVRWNHPMHGVLRPSSFIHLVALTNAHGPFADTVLEQACAFAEAASSPDAPFFVAVNISAMSLFDPDFASRVAATLDHHDLRPDQLIIEITESEIMDDHATSEKVITELSRLGVSLSIDDFGTGYSSLTRLVELPVSEIKIDRSFVAGITSNGPEQAVIEATISLGKRLGLQMVAEGVESQAQADFLAEQGCQLGQGFLYGQAVDAHEFLQTFITPEEHPAPVVAP